jgi:excisionase family DNA binding protein
MSSSLNLLLPSQKERELARSSSSELSFFVSPEQQRKGDVSFSIDGKVVLIPTVALRSFYEVLITLGEGRAVTVLPVEEELTTHQAAEFLSVSRKFLIDELVNKGVLAVRMVGTRRKIPLNDLLAYKEQNRAKRRVALDEMAELADKEGLP